MPNYIVNVGALSAVATRTKTPTLLFTFNIGGGMEEERERLTLATINDGALLEQFDRALDRVVDNVSDINTTTKARKIKLVVKVVPSEDRAFLEVDGEVKTEVAGQDPVKTTAVLSYDNRGRAVAFNRKKRQTEIPFNVTRINEGGEQ
jgi:hypothetical protein